MNLIDVTKNFRTPETCNDFLETMRWPEGVTCFACQSKRVSKYVKQAGTRTRVSARTVSAEEKPVPARILYVCLDCRKQFSVTKGTIFNDTHLSLDKWFLATALMVNAKKGLSALQLQRDLNVAYKTAWYLSHRIRKAMGLIEAADAEPLTGTVEADETYVGGKYDKRRKRPKYHKPAVFGVVQRDGNARAYHMPAITLQTVVEKIKDNVSIDATAIYTDESNLYGSGLYQQPRASDREAQRERMGPRRRAHRDDRRLLGLAQALGEFQFKWNNRKAQDIFVLVIAALVIGSALPYKELIASV